MMHRPQGHGTHGWLADILTHQIDPRPSADPVGVINDPSF